MAPRRIFISHSAKTEPEQRVLRALKTALDAAGFAVLLDQDELELGKGWRHTLNLWMGGCNAAVILLSESALTSKYVPYESAVLSYRNQLDDGFLLLPLLLAPVDRERVDASDLKSSVLDEIQWVGETVAPEVGIQNIVAKMKELPEAPTSIELLAKHVEHLIKGAPDFVLDQQIDRLGIDVGPWLPDEHRAGRVALGLVGAGLELARESLLELKSFLPEPRQKSCEVLVDLLGCSWVDCTTLQRIPRAAASGRTLAVNGVQPMTGRMFVLRACDRRPQQPWACATVDGQVGERPEDWITLIEPALARALDVEPEALDDEIEFQTRDSEQPVFVALPWSEPGGGVLRGLRERFPGVTFFLMTGEPPPADTALAEAEIDYLDPGVHPDDERYHNHHYKTVYRLLTRIRL